MADNDNTTEPAKPQEKQPVEASNPDAAAITPVIPAPAAELEAEDPFDFGGLPRRNLKKNLGCG